MRKLLVLLSFLAAANSAHAQSAQSTSTIDCTKFLNDVRCTTTTRQSPTEIFQESEQQQLMNQQQMQQLGAAIAADRERRRQAKIEKAVKIALGLDNAGEAPPPEDEKPVLLICSIPGGGPSTIALYEKHGRVDVTSGMTTKSRNATFTVGAVLWSSPLWRSSLNRLDGTFLAVGNIPEIRDETVKGTCSVAADRKF